MAMYSTLNAPYRLPIGRPKALHSAAVESLLLCHRRYPYLYHDELIHFMDEEWWIRISQPTVSRVLRHNRISRKKGQIIGDAQSQLLRNSYQAEMAMNFVAEQLVVIDESLFKEQSCWRQQAYAPIGNPARWRQNISRGKTFSILPAYTADGFLPCTGVRLGYFDSEVFYQWVVNELLPYYNPFPQPRIVLILDNVNIHLDTRVQEAAERKGMLVRFLPPYSPDFSPIELTFGLLKAWMRRHWRDLQPTFRGDFKGFLRHAIEASECDRFAREHFKHSAAGYMFDGDYERFCRELEDYGNTS